MFKRRQLMLAGWALFGVSFFLTLVRADAMYTGQAAMSVGRLCPGGHPGPGVDRIGGPRGHQRPDDLDAL